MTTKQTLTRYSTHLKAFCLHVLFLCIISPPASIFCINEFLSFILSRISFVCFTCTYEAHNPFLAGIELIFILVTGIVLRVSAYREDVSGQRRHRRWPKPISASWDALAGAGGAAHGSAQERGLAARPASASRAFPERGGGPGALSCTPPAAAPRHNVIYCEISLWPVRIRRPRRAPSHLLVHLLPWQS